MALNKYLGRAHALIQKYKDEAPFKQFQNLDGQLASFDNLVWFYIDPITGKKTRVLTGQHGVRGHGSAGSDPKYALPEPYGDLVKVFAIEAFNAAVSATEIQARIGSARRLLTNMKGDLHKQTASTIIECFGESRLERVVIFLEFCEHQGLMPRASDQIRRTIRYKRDRTGHSVEATRREKMADEGVIRAVGNIYGKTITRLTQGNAEPGSFRDALATFIALLCCASPNRAAAEVLLLANQELQSYSEDDRAEVFYLDWPGSKGYQDNRNHILSALGGHVEKGLNYFSKACQPGRIVASYYIDPNQTLGQLLGDFHLDSERKARLHLNRKPHLFTLGYALGFYELDAEVHVFTQDAEQLRSTYERTKPARVSHRKDCWQPKYISELQIEDQISSNPSDKAIRPGIRRLLGVSFQNNHTKKFDPNGNRLISIGQLEKVVLDMQNEAFPSFPVGFSTGDLNSVKMDVALFCVLGPQFVKSGSNKTRGGGVTGHHGYYHILVPRSLATAASWDLGQRGEIFLRHGFSSNHFLNFHQLRHYLNTIADKSSIPNEVLTSWSGRKSREQTNEYIHTSHAYRSSRVGDVQAKTNESTHPIRWVSSKEIVREFNLPASVTSTGICTQNLVVSPCEFLNDFISSCFMCPNACHVAGDSDAIETLEKDCQFQYRRLEAVKNDNRLNVSRAMQEWFVLHNGNTQVLTQLVQLMKDMPAGTVISFNEKAQQFNLLDAKSKKLTQVVAKLTDSRKDLQNALERQNKATDEPRSNEDLTKLMAKYNLVETA